MLPANCIDPSIRSTNSLPVNVNSCARPATNCAPRSPSYLAMSNCCKKAHETQSRVMTRIKRANRNMQQLLETLLWLGRENAPLGETEHIHLSSFIKQEISDLSYLTEGKHVTCSFAPDSRETEIATSRAALMIVVSNLIRNAFQHTPKGQVTITLTGTELTVENTISTCNGQCTTPQGEGIGLQLVKRICQRLDWRCTPTHLPNGGMSVSFDPGAKTLVKPRSTPELIEG